MTKVKVRLFARLAELAGTREAEVEIGEGLTAGDVFALMSREHPKIAGMKVAFAVNQEYADAGQQLREGDEVALIPPVSGGAPLSSRAERSAAEGSEIAMCIRLAEAEMHFEVPDLSTSPSIASRSGYGRDDKCRARCGDVL